jgi:predicted RNase H-like HicB family nuclease
MKTKSSKILEYNVLFTAESEGGYSVIVPDLPGCISQGDTFEEAEANIKEAIELYLEEADPELYHVTPQQNQQQFIRSVQIHL